MNESRVRKQQHLRSCLDNSDQLSQQLNSKKEEKKVLELELNFDDKTSTDQVKNLFKGVHLISAEFDQCNLTGKHFGKGKVKVRVDKNQEEMIKDRMTETPNIKSKKVEEGNYNRKYDFMGMSGSKWYNNSVSQENKHYKDKEYDHKHRAQREFGDSQIFGDKKHEYKERNHQQEHINDNLNNWGSVKNQNLNKPRGWKPMNPVKENANFLKNTLLHSTRSVKK